MDQQSSERIARFRKAGVPARMLKTTAAKEGFPQISAIVDSKQYLDKTLYRSYVVSGKQSYRAVSVFAREFTLAKVGVHFLSAPQIARDLRLSERDYDNTPEYALNLGDGYWVITELEGLSDLPLSQAREVESLVIRHVNRGGGLVVESQASGQPLSRGYADMVESFEVVNV